MPRTVRVEVQPDHLKRLTSVRSPADAIEELVWNSLDADAKNVTITVDRNGMGGVERVEISDDGHGMRLADSVEAFGSLGGSRKTKSGRSREGRFLHGRLGKGRYKAFGLGSFVEWQSVTKDGGALQTFSISGSIEDLCTFRFSDVGAAATTAAVGTRVIVTGFQRDFNTLPHDQVVEALVSTFAMYLKQYPDVRIVLDGVVLDPSRAIEHLTSYPVGPVTVENGRVKGELTIIEWRFKVERSLFLCDLSGVALDRTAVGVRAPHQSFTAYLRSGVVAEASEQGLLGFDAMFPRLAPLLEESRAIIKQHFREREAARVASLVEEWKQEKIYPFESEPTDTIEKVEQQVFDVVALNVHSYLPAFEEGDRDSKKLTFRFLRDALRNDAGNLQRILKDVLNLPATKQKELAELLDRTSLAAIINASRVVASRLDFLRGLEVLVFDKDLRSHVRERSQLHRLIADNTWIFGEQYHLMVDDQSLTTALREHFKDRKDHRVDVLDATEVLREDNRRGILDLMLARVEPHASTERRSYLVVELKKPNVRIDEKAINQVTSYAHALTRHERFRGPDTSWNFWAVSSDVTDLITSQQMSDRPPGVVREVNGAKIWVRTWSEIIRSCQARLHFFQSQLSLKADRGQALEYLRQQYQAFIPAAAKATVVLED